MTVRPKGCGMDAANCQPVQDVLSGNRRGIAEKRRKCETPGGLFIATLESYLKVLLWWLARVVVADAADGLRGDKTHGELPHRRHSR